MQDFVPGQRWINDAQLQMGLGSVLKTDFRTVTIIFLATGETFVYSKESVPLTRVRFAPGDQIFTLDDASLEVVAVEEAAGLISYTGKDDVGGLQVVDESLLSNYIQLNRPTERFFNGQIDRDIWFDLRYQTRQIQSRLAANPLYGLVGGRVSLIPHQLYIAQSVANRFAPRVLLADEVGLGKTIEAGMIIHQQLVTERANRVLIVVPESLVHQWLMEMLRRFNLMFKIFDDERFDSLVDVDEHSGETVSGQLNPFLSEQLVLCSLEFLSSRPEIFKQCRSAGWDLMVVDEAHHLQWSEEDPGFEYQLIESLATNTEGILLLTATPEQLGKSSHFARLRLLDPERFPDYQQFEVEEEQYRPIADIVDELMEGKELSRETRAGLVAHLGEETTSEYLGKILESESAQDKKAPTEALVEKLLDRHGTGRVLFRNTRATIKGFPERIVSPKPQELPEAYKDLLATFTGSHFSEPQLLLCPELLYQVVNEDQPENWLKIDPRVAQLTSLLKDLRPEKVLVITASADTVLDLSSFLKITQGIDAAVFHEDMSMVERDRAAAFFADKISGSQVMICSEIGSEGRNFQFAHHLVLFDLPLDPDLLEQRIGRLDRIGQTETINIHVLYLKNSAQEIMFNWYHTALNAFENTCPTGYSVFSQVENDILETLHQPQGDHSGIIDKSRALHNDFTLALQQGRDRLLEFNSCRPSVAQSLCDEAVLQDQESGLRQYMELFFDCIGVDYEVHSEQCYTIHASSHMLVQFPQLPEDGMTVTYDRETALSFEDVHFLTWEHPLVTGAIDIVAGGELGNTSVVALPLTGVTRGTMALESVFILESASTQESNTSRFLPPTTIRIMIDQTGKRLDHLPVPQSMDENAERLKPEMVRRIVKMKERLFRKMVDASENFAQKLSPGILEVARGKSTDLLTNEISRLEALSEVNPNVRPEEIEFYRNQLKTVGDKLGSSSLRLDSMRIIVAT